MGEMIASGVFEADEKLPPVRILTKRLQVGPSTLREAMVSLAALGLVEISHGKGIFVKHLPIATLRARLAWLGAGLSHKDIWEARIALETFAVELAAVRRVPKDLDEMEKAVCMMDQEIASGDFGVQSDTAFHIYILQASKNSLLIQLGEQVGTLSLRVRELALQEPDRPTSSNEEHRAILEAIRKQDPEESANQMRAHLKWGLKFAAFKGGGTQ
jgi:GntR family transcriptional repressor for pyruvate dehydrogenase complex